MIGLYFCGESIVFLWVLIKLLGSFVVMGFAMLLFHIFIHYVSVCYVINSCHFAFLCVLLAWLYKSKCKYKKIWPLDKKIWPLDNTFGFRSPVFNFGFALVSSVAANTWGCIAQYFALFS